MDSSFHGVGHLSLIRVDSSFHGLGHLRLVSVDSSFHGLNGRMKEGHVLFNGTLSTFHLRLYWKEGGKEMFYLMLHSAHFIYGYNRRKEGNVLFNDALNTFYLQLYGISHMVKEHLYNKEGNLLLTLYGLLFLINSNGLLR